MAQFPESQTDSIEIIDASIYSPVVLNGPFSDRLAFLRQKNNEPADDALVLTTMHASKGREWAAVAVIRAEETIVPDETSPESEERRLFYVALTRARDWLQVSTAKKNPTSRFVVEAGLA